MEQFQPVLLIGSSIQLGDGKVAAVIAVDRLGFNIQYKNIIHFILWSEWENRENKPCL